MNMRETSQARMVRRVVLRGGNGAGAAWHLGAVKQSPTSLVVDLG